MRLKKMIRTWAILYQLIKKSVIIDLQERADIFSSEQQQILRQKSLTKRNLDKIRITCVIAFTYCRVRANSHSVVVSCLIRS